jgi:hypothetical protein
MENNDCCRIQFSRINCGPCSNTEPLSNMSRVSSAAWATYQRNVIHVVNDQPLMFWRIFRYPAQMCLYDVVSVEERHLTVWFNPHLPRLQIIGYRVNEV